MCANNGDPDQTPRGIWSWSELFAYVSQKGRYVYMG